MKGHIPLRITLFWILTVIFLPAIAQQPPADSCPTLEISGPDLSRPQPTFIYSIVLHDLNPSLQPTFQWETSAGLIIAGQGTQKIEVEPGTVSSLTVTITVGGLPTSCQSKASYSSIACPAPVAPRRVAQIGPPDIDNEKARLDAHAAELGKVPSAYAYIIFYRGRQKGKEDPGKRATRVRDYLVKEYKLEPSRVVIVEGGMRDLETIELWIAPVESTVPEADPPKSR